MKHNIILIAVIDEAYGIGHEGKLLTHLPEDLKNFKEVTEGNIVVMGRKTFESIGKPLPNRRNIVISTTMGPTEGVEVVRDPLEVLNMSEGELTFIIGGSNLYSFFEPTAKAILLTRIHTKFKEVDTWFPSINYGEWALVAKRFVEGHNYPYSFERYLKR